MKIVVDKMPERTEECPNITHEGNFEGYKRFGCIHAPIACPGVKKCPFYIGLEDTMRKGKRDGNG